MGPAIAYAEEQMVQDEVIPVSEPAPADVSPLLAALQAREVRVADRETAIDDRLRALANAEEELTRRLVDVEAAEASLMAALALSETANDSDIARLTTVYENMKPADAAGLFEQMAPDFASGFLVRMNPQAAAAILAGLEPQTAYSISVIIAGRNANAPTE
ncbi:hypothetical protein L0664_11025 [Octadecabacter sp. G9-8]|uniref:Magnesium transporter MgtE intracellular domain-containing protein n=2 Tax=Octadecabacter dasysiphoniae TaxID=2909341 RepID=A0ABS9CXN1_9RHOB|nr:hypothetical protein [Octadecabacter dasysiphoniae]MCF2871597.1 hypothetical protein [Octadecabacter dasysiphoniae]